MDTADLQQRLARFIRRHKTEFAQLPSIQTQLLELGAMTLTVEHYRLKGYEVHPANTREGRFRVKVTSRGYPWNFSWFIATRGELAVEIHANMPVLGHYGHDGGRYVVDVAVCRADKLPGLSSTQREWNCMDNQDLVTFLEAKKLVVYPMLLAQFVGIVHEIKPSFLRRISPEFRSAGHLLPALVSTGHPARTAREIILGYRDRGMHLSVVTSFDHHLARMSDGQVEVSPFEAPIDTPAGSVKTAAV